MKRVGEKAPSFTLKDLHGNSSTLADLTATAPGLLVFFRVSCPTCQYTLPFLDRLRQAVPGAPIVAIAQDSAADAQAFAQRFNVNLPFLLDDQDYSVSRSYGVEIVPSIFVLDRDGKIIFAIEGWSRDDFEALVQLIKPPDAPPPVIFKPQETVHPFKAG